MICSFKEALTGTPDSDPNRRSGAIFEMLVRRFSLLCVVLLALGRPAATLW
jgi:hypothetical protein